MNFKHTSVVSANGNRETPFQMKGKNHVLKLSTSWWSRETKHKQHEHDRIFWQDNKAAHLQNQHLEVSVTGEFAQNSSKNDIND